MGTITSLTETGEWEKVWEGLAASDAAPVLLFKASPYCGVSRGAEERFLKFAESLGDDAEVALYRIDVVNARAVSQRVATDAGVTHQSPQALLIGAGQKVVWDASHYSIKEEALAEAVSAL